MKLIFLIIALALPMSAFAKSVVVVNSANESKVTSSDIKKLFLARKGSFDNGDPAKLATLESDSDIRKAFNQMVLNKSESQYTGYWAKMRFTGRATPPVELETSAAVRDFVSKHKGAIGVMDKADVNEQVRVVFEF